MSQRATGRLTGLAPAALLVTLLSACGLPPGAWRPEFGRAVTTTYEKHLSRAETGDTESQNVVGFMLFHGEGVPQDRIRARAWFETAARLGNARAQGNLAAMDALDEARRGGTRGAARHTRLEPGGPSGRPEGEGLYQKFCSGCHGFNGIAAYVHSPSFALGESLDKSDGQLMQSLLKGTGEMPNWDDKLSLGELREALRFVRTLRLTYEGGVRETLRGAPPYFYLFGPMKPKI